MTIHITEPVHAVLTHMLANADQEFFGRRLVVELDLMPGTVYPLLRRLDEHGWLISRWETKRDAPTRIGGQLRRFYRIDRRKIPTIGRALAEASSLINRASTPR